MNSRNGGEKTEFGPGKTALYYNNVGLFSDPFLEDRLPNLEKYYNHPSTSYLNEFWNVEESESQKFNNAFQAIMNLWDKLDKNVPKYCSKERQLQNSWIDKIFEILGWTIELEETATKNGITNYPDYALFSSIEDWKKSKDLEGNGKFKRAVAVADAKDWGVNLDGKGLSNKNPSYQIVNYLRQTEKTWGILTDGKYWRLYSVRSESKHTTFYEIDLEKILATGDIQRFKYFYNFFRSDAFVIDSKLSDRCFLDFVFEDGQVYSERVEENLKLRAHEVVQYITKGFVGNKKNLRPDELKAIYDHSLYYLFKLLFVLNCESRGLLEVNKQDDYYNNGSLRKKCIEIKEQWEQRSNWSNQPRTYNYINDLFNLLEGGDSQIGVHGFGNEIFKTGDANFYATNSIPDLYLNQALLELATNLEDGGERLFVDYKILSADHIGSLFEGLLEYKLAESSDGIFLVNDKGERKKTASYYTPDYIVNFMVSESLSGLVSQKDTKQILNVKTCDPAMGSGHFLLGTLKFLEKTVQDYQNRNPDSKNNIPFDRIRHQIINNCIYGVDKNPLAVELGRFSLWIYSAEKGDRLQSLSKQIKLGNSLIDNDTKNNLNFVWPKEFPSVFPNGFDAVIGNPPYLGEKGNKEIFREIREGGVLASKTYKRKMDLFYWFIMKGIELTNKNGLVSLITTNYWSTADGAENLKECLREKGSFNRYVDFLGSTIFRDAKGQCNSIFFYEKGRNWDKSEVILNRATELFENESLKWKRELDIHSPKYFVKEKVFLKDICPEEGPWSLSQKNVTSNESERNDAEKIDKSRFTKYFGKNAISRGVETGSDKVTKALIEASVEKKNISIKDVNQFSLKEGIFVISKAEAKEKNIEKELLLNWYKNSALGYYVIDNSSTAKLIFVDSKTDIKSFPNAKNHLSKYRNLLASREQANNEDKNWFWIRGPKRDKIYNKVTLVCPYRAKVPKFALSKKEVYGAGDMYFVIDFFGYTPEVVLGYLNSSFVEDWFFQFGKKKGGLFELYQTPLSEIPVPLFSLDAQKTIQAGVANILGLIEEYKPLIGSSQKMKDVLDVYSENKKTAIVSVRKKFDSNEANEFIKKLIGYTSKIDTTVYAEMVFQTENKKSKKAKAK